MSEQKVRGIPHWRKFKEAANALEKSGAAFPPSFPNAKNALKMNSIFIKNCPKFYVPQINEVLNVGKKKKDYIAFEDDELINLPYPVTILLSESWVRTAPREEDALHNSWKISVFSQPKQNGHIVCTSTVYDPDAKVWVCMPIAIELAKAPLPAEKGVGYGLGCRYYGDPATQELLKQMKDAGLAEEEGLKDFDEDVAALMSLIKLLSVQGMEKVKIELPDKLAKKHAKHSNDTSDYSYHVLKIGGDIWDSPYVLESTNGSGKRSHLRRGHIRRLAHKNVWVRASFVQGSKEGFVEKEYHVT